MSPLFIDGLMVLVDTDDAPLLSRQTWHLASMGGALYATRNVTKSPHATEAMHRLILGSPPDSWRVGDHENGNTLDNRKANLRWISRRGNAINSKRRRSGETIGVDFIARGGKWRARMHDNGKGRHLGIFATEAEAITARRTAEQQREIA